MGCTSSKSAVQAIEIKDGKVTKTNKQIKVVASDEMLINESNAIMVNEKSKSAKSRDSGIGEMEFERTYSNPIITEESDPNLIEDVENDVRPKTPELSLIGRQFQDKSAGRTRSKAILEELEAEGLISGSKIERGGSAFEVRLGPLQPLEPLAPIRRPPPRLERMKSEKKLPSKAELEEKMKKVEDRRKEALQRRSRLASQLARDQSFAAKLNSDSDNEMFEDKQVPEKVKQNKEKDVTKSTVFDAASVDSLDAASPGLTDSTDAFYKDITPAVNAPFS